MYFPTNNTQKQQIITVMHTAVIHLKYSSIEILNCLCFEREILSLQKDSSCFALENNVTIIAQPVYQISPIKFS
jgi:hypothetical protein